MINYSISINSCKPGTKKTEQTYATKAYGTSQCTEVIDIHKFAKHISDHGSVYSRGDVVGLLTQAVDCLREMMLKARRSDSETWATSTPNSPQKVLTPPTSSTLRKSKR